MLCDSIVICKDIFSCQAFCIFMLQSSSRCFFIPTPDVTCATRVPSGGALIPLDLLHTHTTSAVTQRTIVLFACKQDLGSFFFMESTTLM
jgi:hypothetical protein